MAYLSFSSSTKRQYVVYSSSPKTDTHLVGLFKTSSKKVNSFKARYSSLLLYSSVKDSPSKRKEMSSLVNSFVSIGKSVSSVCSAIIIQL